VLIRSTTFVSALLAFSVLAHGSAAAEDAADRERAIRDHEQRLLEQSREPTRAAQAAAKRHAAEKRRLAAESNRRDAENATLAAIDKVAADLGNLLTSPASFSVLAVHPEQITIAGGTNLGLKPGDPVRCFSRGEPIVSNGEQVGFDERSIGEGRIDEVREKLSVITLTARAVEPKNGDVCYRRMTDLGKIALMPFLYGGQRTRLGEHIAERLYDGLSEHGLTLVERAQLTRVLAEQRLGESALMDATNAAHIGELAGADSLLFGTIGDVGESIVVSARVVRARDGIVLTSRELSLPKNDTSLAMLEPITVADDVTITKANEAAGELSLDDPAKRARKFLARADALLAAGKVADASENFSQALTIKPDLPEIQKFAQKLGEVSARDARAAVAKARALIAAGQTREASQAFAEALRLKPDLPEAQDLAEKLGKLPAKNAQVALAKAEVLAEAGRMQEASAALDEVLQFKPNLPGAKEVAGKIKPSLRAQQAVARANLLIEAGKGVEAEKALSEAIALDPNLPGISEASSRLGELRKAETAAPAAQRRGFDAFDARQRISDPACARALNDSLLPALQEFAAYLESQSRAVEEAMENGELTANAAASVLNEYFNRSARFRTSIEASRVACQKDPQGLTVITMTEQQLSNTDRSFRQVAEELFRLVQGSLSKLTTDPTQEN
jgi:tetratricopeptide (TPR) repeat protein/TolB-like protein